ncbi:MAG: hypothetical protein SGARI_004309 [Bacillariaceae sp.]
MIQFASRQDIDDFLTGGSQETKLTKDDPEYQARVRYLSDYLFGNHQYKDMDGNPIPGATDEWIYCILVPGFGTNHREDPNVKIFNLKVLLLEDDKTHSKEDEGVVMVATRDIPKGEEICNSYSHCGPAPQFVQDFAKEHSVPMVFPGCNDFVKE